ncbi:uncharacterized protein [Maniola hyperantus]|uniref:uncharacterized protein n=1 Tax=Aphantopus hyperantus TaxID=2795564 RepID=UPI0021441276
MSACNTKSELLAIYRLEFYKNKHNWKLSTKRHNGMKCSKKKHVEKVNVNTTHEVENWEENEVSDPLNVGFVTSEPGTSPPQPSLSQEWQEPINIWPRGAHAEDTLTCNQHQVSTEECCTAEPTAAMEREPELHNLVLEQNAQNMAKWTNRGGAEGEGEGDGRAGCDEGKAPVVPPPPINEIWPEEAAAKLWDAIDGNCPAELLDAPLQQEGHNSSVDSLSHFCRGAHVVPHSSETDLSLPPPLQIPHPASLSHMTTQQLRKTVEHSAKTLKVLESEYEWRRLRQRENYGMDDLDEVLHPSLPHPPITDRVLAGSHRAWGVTEPWQVWEAGDAQLVQLVEPQPAQGVGVTYPTWSVGELRQAEGVVEPQPAWGLRNLQPAYSEGETHQARGVGVSYPTWSDGETHQARGVGLSYPTWSEREIHQVLGVREPQQVWSEGEIHQVLGVRELQQVWSEGEIHQVLGVREPQQVWSEGEIHQVLRVREPQQVWSEGEIHQAQRVGVPYPTWREGEIHQARELGESQLFALLMRKPHPAWSVAETHQAWGVREPQPIWSEGETHQVRGVGGPQPVRGAGKPRTYWRSEGEAHQLQGSRELQHACGVEEPQPASSEGVREPHQDRGVTKPPPGWSEGEHQARGVVEPLVVKKPRTYWRSEGEIHQVRGSREPQHACGVGEPHLAGEIHQARGAGLRYQAWSGGEPHQARRVGELQLACGVRKRQPAWSEEQTLQVRGAGEARQRGRGRGRVPRSGLWGG